MGNGVGTVGAHEPPGHDRRSRTAALHETPRQGVADSAGRETPVAALPGKREAMHAPHEEAGSRGGRKALVTRHPTNVEATSFGGLSRSDLMSRVRSQGNKTT